MGSISDSITNKRIKIPRLLIVVIALLNITPVLAQKIPSENLLPEDTLIFEHKSDPQNGNRVDIIQVDGPGFKYAYRISTLGQGEGGPVLNYLVNKEIHKGDILFLSFYMRSLKSMKESGQSFFHISLNRFVKGKYEWPPLLERGLSFGKVWELQQIPFIAAEDSPAGSSQFVINIGAFPQTMEIGKISLLNYYQSVNFRTLPKSIVSYDGDSPDAPWRLAAAQRIEKYRKGNLNIRLLDQKGKPLSGASVNFKLKKNSFGWGTAVNSKMLLDSLVNTKYKDTLLKYFNKVVFENEMKPRNWEKSDHALTKKAVKWFKKHRIDVRGHVMVWPSWKNSPQLLPYKNDTAALRQAILKSISAQTGEMNGQFTEWDVVNEPYAHHDILELFGKEIMLDWFNSAAAMAPGVKLSLNEYTMFFGEGENSASEKFYNTIKFLKDHHSPINMLEEQGHIGGSPPGIPYVISRLNHFSELGLPIQITEFDITSDDDEFKARYLRDFMTAVFSEPKAVGFVQWGFWEGAHWIPAAALWDKNWNIREHGRMYTKLVTKTWSTNITALTGNNGALSIRGFTGDYLITITKGKTKKQIYTKLTTSGQSLTQELSISR